MRVRVSLFVTCLVDTFFPDVGVSAVRLLRRLGVDVDFPAGQTCCGQPAYNSGFPGAAREGAVQFIRAFEGSEWVVSPSGSCAAMVRHHFPELVAGSSLEREARRLAERTYELTQFITEVLGIEDLGGRFPGVGTYHSSCHMARGLGVREAPKRLLRRVRDFQLIDLPAEEECCGFGGTFAVKMPSLSTAMADEKLRRVEETSAHYLLGSDMACLMHLRGRMEKLGGRVEVMHVAQLLERATRASALAEEGARNGALSEGAGSGEAVAQ